MTFSGFKKKWLGKRIDYDHVYLYQCVDLIKQYWYEVYGVSAGSWGNAYDYWRRPHKDMLKYFNRVAGSRVKTGDVVVFYPLNSSRPYGHIGVATGRATSTSVEVLEQNGGWPMTALGLGTDAIRATYIKRSRVAGIIRRKSTSPSQPAPIRIVRVKPGWGLSNVAKAAKFKDWWSPTRWMAITKLNVGNTNWRKFNKSLHAGQRVRVRR